MSHVSCLIESASFRSTPQPLSNIGYNSHLTALSVAGSSKLSCKPFIVDGVQVGYISPHVSSHLSAYNRVFVMVVGPNDGEILHVTLNPEIKTFTERTNKVAEVMMDLRQKDVFSTLKGWRDEASRFQYNLCG